MRRLPTILSSLLFTLFAMAFAVGQDSGQDDEETPASSPFTALREGEQKRIEEELEGSWSLISLETQSEIIDAANFSGYAQFHEGYASLLLMAAEEYDVVFGSGLGYTILTGAYRYRITDEPLLQLASISGFDNFYNGVNFDFHRTGAGSEYELQVADNDLVMSQVDGDTYRFVRMPSNSGFPEKTVERLRRDRSGWDFDD